MERSQKWKNFTQRPQKTEWAPENERSEKENLKEKMGIEGTSTGAGKLDDYISFVFRKAIDHLLIDHILSTLHYSKSILVTLDEKIIITQHWNKYYFKVLLLLYKSRYLNVMFELQINIQLFLHKFLK